MLGVNIRHLLTNHSNNDTYDESLGVHKYGINPSDL